MLSVALLLLASPVERALGDGIADGGIHLTYKVRFNGLAVGQSYYTWVEQEAGVTWISKELAPSGPLAAFYRVADRFVARVRSEDGRAEFLYEYIDEPRGRRQDRWTTIDWPRRRAVFWRVNHKEDGTDRREVTVEEGTQWPLTVPYWYARQRSGGVDGRRLPILSAYKLKEVRLTERRGEVVDCGLGQVLCDRIDGEVWYRGERQRAGSFKAWVRQAEPRVPVRIDSRLNFGSLSETLVKQGATDRIPEVPAPPVDR